MVADLLTSTTWTCCIWEIRKRDRNGEQGGTMKIHDQGGADDEFPTFTSWIFLLVMDYLFPFLLSVIAKAFDSHQQIRDISDGKLAQLK